MFRIKKRQIKKVGKPPGSLIHVGDKLEEKVRLSVIDYSDTAYEEKEITSVDEIAAFRDKSSITWLNVDGLHDISVIESVGKQFDIHPLVLEDILNTESRPKIEDYDDYVFFILKMFDYDEGTKKISSEQVSLLMLQDTVLSFQEKHGDVFDSLRQRLRNGKGTIRKRKSDYVTYAIIDSIVDRYYLILEKLGLELEDIHEKITKNPQQDDLQMLHSLRQEVIALRNSILPLRELVNNYLHLESELIEDDTKNYLRDLYDHTIQVIETIESYRDAISGLFDVSLSQIVNKTNEIMKVLTMIAIIFIPVTFIAGVYGMNFENMPELSSTYGYPFVLITMTTIAVSMLLFFKKRRWI